jgi:hypothetical protein
MNGESYRLKHSKARRQRQLALDTGVTVDPDTGEIHQPAGSSGTPPAKPAPPPPQ